jgi:hypothetical protein
VIFGTGFEPDNSFPLGVYSDDPTQYEASKLVLSEFVNTDDQGDFSMLIQIEPSDVDAYGVLRYHVLAVTTAPSEQDPWCHQEPEEDDTYSYQACRIGPLACFQGGPIVVISGPAAEERNLTPPATSSASSHLPTDPGGQYEPWLATDGALETSWVEGVPGPGIGEWFMLTFPGAAEISYINLDVGYDRDADSFYANNRIRRATLIFSGGEQIDVTLSDIRGMQTIALAHYAGSNIETTFVKLIIQEVYPGSEYDDTCLAEIAVWGIMR